MAESRLTGFGVTEFTQQLGNVAALNQFNTTITVPNSLQAQFPENDRFVEKIGFAVKAANVPDSTIGQIEVPHRGFKMRVPGDRDLSGTWDVTVRSDVDSVARAVLERWSDAVVGNVEHDTVEEDDVTNLFGTGVVHQLNRNNRILKTWHMGMIWPTTVGAISYDMSAENTVVEFPVTFVYHIVESNTTRNNLISDPDATSGSTRF